MFEITDQLILRRNGRDDRSGTRVDPVRDDRRQGREYRSGGGHNNRNGNQRRASNPDSGRSSAGQREPQQRDRIEQRAVAARTPSPSRRRQSPRRVELTPRNDGAAPEQGSEVAVPAAVEEACTPTHSPTPERSSDESVSSECSPPPGSPSPDKPKAPQWVEKLHKDSGKVFYLNKANGEKTWKKPEDEAAGELAAKTSVHPLQKKQFPGVDSNKSDMLCQQFKKSMEKLGPADDGRDKRVQASGRQSAKVLDVPGSGGCGLSRPAAYGSVYAGWTN